MNGVTETSAIGNRICKCENEGDRGEILPEVKKLLHIPDLRLIPERIENPEMNSSQA